MCYSSVMERTYTFVFDRDPEGGFVVTCPALPGLVTHGQTMDEAREMARDALDGFIQVLVEDGEEVPESDSPDALPRYDRLAHSLRDEQQSPILEPISTRTPAAA
jgi:predicted RNase H-like HicB family nuclease